MKRLLPVEKPDANAGDGRCSRVVCAGVTLVNWTDGQLKALTVSVRLPAAPKEVRSVSGQKAIPSKCADGAVAFALKLEEGR